MSSIKYTLTSMEGVAQDYYSYVNIREASFWLESSVRYSDIWRKQSTEHRKKALITATRLIDKLRFIGQPTSKITAWPRTGKNPNTSKQLDGENIPIEVEQATSLLAAEIILSDEREIDGFFNIDIRHLPDDTEDIKYKIKYPIIEHCLIDYLDLFYYSTEVVPEHLAGAEEEVKTKPQRKPSFGDGINQVNFMKTLSEKKDESRNPKEVQ